MAHLHMLAHFQHSGDSESDEPAKTSNPDSGNNDDLVTAKRLKMLSSLIL